jgi:hypothetical protein
MCSPIDYRSEVLKRPSVGCSVNPELGWRALERARVRGPVPKHPQVRYPPSAGVRNAVPRMAQPVQFPNLEQVRWTDS